MHRLLGPFAVVVALAAWPAGAAAAEWRCEASALRAQVLTAPAVEPAVANRGAACQEAGGGGAFAPSSLPVGGLSASGRERRPGGGGPGGAPPE